MSWQEQIQVLSDQELVDLCGYLYGFVQIDHADRNQLEEKLLHGKNRNIFYLIDKNAYKTIKRLIRHPDRSLTYRYYPVDQLLELGIIEVIPAWDNDEDHGWYRICDEAMAFAMKVSRARHFDPLIATMQKMDELLLGLFHTYGLLELHQCAEMLEEYGITMAPQRLFAAITWRLTLRDHLHGFQIRQHGDTMAFIMLRGLDFILTYQGIRRYSQYYYDEISESQVRQRRDRYYARHLPEVKALAQYLRPSFSRKFIRTIIEELIDAYQYHEREFQFTAMIQRVFDPQAAAAKITAAKMALPDIYRKGHCRNDEQEQDQKESL